MFAAKELYAELVALSYSQRGGGGLLVIERAWMVVAMH
jgi:hypothetical protein